MVIENKKELTKKEQIREERRHFLAKSRYAAYMSPLMLSMVVNKDAQAHSGGGHHGGGHHGGGHHGRGNDDDRDDD